MMRFVVNSGRSRPERFGLLLSNQSLSGAVFSTSESARSSPAVEQYQHQNNEKRRRRRRRLLGKDDGLTLQHFINKSKSTSKNQREHVGERPLGAILDPRRLDLEDNNNSSLSFHIKTYGCQMNVNDSDIVRSLLLGAGLRETLSEESADVLLTNTCAIREGAEAKVWHRLRDLKGKRNKTKLQQQNRKQKRAAIAGAGDDSGNGHSCSSSQRHKRKNNTKAVVGVLGCMAERLKEELFKDELADLVVGPDAYRDLPRLVKMLSHKATNDGTNNDKDESDQIKDNSDSLERAVNVELSLDETYADIIPVRQLQANTDNDNSISAFSSIQRGCSNRCSFCIVPFTRGQERSRPLDSIVDEIKRLHFEGDANGNGGIREITLLGQNVNSYHDRSAVALEARPPEQHFLPLSNAGFRSRQRRDKYAGGYYFVDLLEKVSEISPELRVRFTSPHPKDYPAALLQLMAERSNVCKNLHMPVQSGSTTMLKRMKRGYTREAYLQLLEDVGTAMPTTNVAISTDIITGFCGETETEHEDTLSLMKWVRYDQAFMFAYSSREQTHAARTMEDDVPEQVKQRRLREIINTFREEVHQKNTEEIGRLRLVLVEGESKKSSAERTTWQGRTDQNKRIVFPVTDVVDDGNASTVFCWSDHDLLNVLQQSTATNNDSSATGVLIMPKRRDEIIHQYRPSASKLQRGEYAVVQVTEANGTTLLGRLLFKTSMVGFDRLGLATNDEESLRQAAKLTNLFHYHDEDDHEHSVVMM